MPVSAYCPPHPVLVGSYDPSDVTFLLKDLTDSDLERPVSEREGLMQGGGHYSETLPIEYQPTSEYRALFEELLASQASRIATLARLLASRLLFMHPDGDITLVSLARAGTPVGVLLTRILREAGVDVRHYSVSIIRDRGLDTNAMRYVLDRHSDRSVRFVDGWTGKGVINRELAREVAQLNEQFGVSIDAELAVLADPAWATRLAATRQDILIPSAALNSTVSGLTSRSVLNHLIGPDDLHGAKVYREFADVDVSRRFVDTVHDAPVDPEYARACAHDPDNVADPDWRGWKTTEAIQAEFDLPSVNLVKPGIGETTRVLLRRVPWKILYDPRREASLKHIRALAADRNVEMVAREMPYAAVGLIAPVQADVQ